MIELVALMLTLGVIFKTAVRRGGKPWIWAPLGLIGFVVLNFAVAMWLGRVTGMHMMAAWSWLGLCFAGAWFVTGLKGAGTTWTCPDCGLYNDPSTLVCDCGHTYEADVIEEEA